MTDLPDVKLKAVLNFPANIVDGTGTDVSKINGKYRIDLAYDDFTPPLASITDPDNSVMLIWNTVTEQYGLAPTSLLLGAGATFPSDDTPLAPGTAAPGTSLLYARGDHVHPAGDVPAASEVPFTPMGTIAATDVQAAIVELDEGKVAKAGDTMTGALGIGMPPITASPNNYLLNISNQIDYEFDVGREFIELDVWDDIPINGPTFYLGRAHGTQLVPTAVANGDSLGEFAFYGKDTVDWAHGGSIVAVVDGVVGAGSVPLALTFYTGSTLGGSERLRIASNGKVTLTSPVAITDATQVPTKLYVDTQVATRAPLATISTSAPSGGVDGDVWYQVT